MKLYKTKKNCGKLLLGNTGILYRDDTADRMWFLFRTKTDKNEETAEENKEEDKVQIGLTVDSLL